MKIRIKRQVIDYPAGAVLDVLSPVSNLGDGWIVADIRGLGLSGERGEPLAGVHLHVTEFDEATQLSVKGPGKI